MHKYPVEENALSPENTVFDELCQRIRSTPPCQGVSQLDVVNLPVPLVSVFRKAIRSGSISQADFAISLAFTQQQAAFLANLLMEKGYLSVSKGEIGSETVYKVRFVRKRKRRVPSDVWSKLDLLENSTIEVSPDRTTESFPSAPH